MSASRGPQLVLKQGRERSLLRGHPWVFSGAVQALRGTVEQGDTVRVCAHDGEFLAWAAYNAELADLRARLGLRRGASRSTTASSRAGSRPRSRGGARCCAPPTCARAGWSTPSRTGSRAGRSIAIGDQLVLQATSAGAARHPRTDRARARAGERRSPPSTSAPRARCSSSRASPRAARPLLGAAPDGAARDRGARRCATRSTCARATRPASTSTSATTARCCARSRPAATCSTASATAAASA